MSEFTENLRAESLEAAYRILFALAPPGLDKNLLKNSIQKLLTTGLCLKCNRCGKGFEQLPKSSVGLEACCKRYVHSQNTLKRYYSDESYRERVMKRSRNSYVPKKNISHISRDSSPDVSPHTADDLTTEPGSPPPFPPVLVRQHARIHDF